MGRAPTTSSAVALRHNCWALASAIARGLVCGMPPLPKENFRSGGVEEGADPWEDAKFMVSYSWS